MNDNLARSNGNVGASASEEMSFSLVDILDNLFYFRWHFLITFLLVFGIALMYSILSTPIFSADALIQVEERKGSSLGALTQVANALGAQQSPVLGEIEIIRSRSVVGRAVDSLKANIEISVENRIPIFGGWLSRVLPRGVDGLVSPLFGIEKFAWGGEQLLIDELVVPPSLVGKPLTLAIGADKKWEVFDKEGNLLANNASGQQVIVAMDGKLRIDFASIKARPGAKFRIVVYTIQSRVNQVLGALAVVEAKRQSNILKLTYESPNAAYAASMLNAISDVYIRQNIDRRSEEAELSLRFLNEELPRLRTQLDLSEKALNDFRSQTKTIDISAEIKELLSKATAIEKSQLELDLKRRELIEKYDPSHPIMKALDSQLQGIRAEYAQLNLQITKLPIIEQSYIRLARDVQVNNQLYVSLLNNAQQLQIAKAGTIGNVSIVDRAVIPEFPARPKKTLIVAIGGLLGLFSGFIVCQMLALISRVVRDPKKFEMLTGLPTLAILPLDDDQLSRLDGITEETAFLLAKERPGAASIEALRSLRTSLLFKLSEKPGAKVVLITSAVPAQGKSFISVNLSYLLAATGKRVLLVEADIRLASSNRYLTYDKETPGLSSVLKDICTVQSAILKDIFPNFDFLPSGPATRNPGDLLATDHMRKLIAEMASLYDYVIIDSPPLLPVHDARSLGKFADLNLFVARQDEVSYSEVFDAIDVFSKSGNSFDGLVFNGFVPSRMRYGYGYGYGYRRYGKSAKYGYRHNYGRYRKYGEYGYGPSNDSSDVPNRR